MTKPPAHRQGGWSPYPCDLACSTEPAAASGRHRRTPQRGSLDGVGRYYESGERPPFHRASAFGLRLRFGEAPWYRITFSSPPSCQNRPARGF